MKPLTYFLIVWLVFYTFINIADLQTHESTHKVIYRYFGYDSIIEYNWLSFSANTTVIYNNHSISLAEIDKLRELQALTEIHGYNSFHIIVAIMFSALLIGTAIILVAEASLKKEPR